MGRLGVGSGAMLQVVLTALLTTTPPLVQAPEERVPLVLPPPPYPGYVAPAPPPRTRYLPNRVTRPPPAPLPPANLGLFFAPLSLFSLSFWLEADVALIGGLDVFANFGGGPLGQLGFDLGLRYYVQGSSLDGFFVDVRGAGFSLPAGGLWMMGPGLQIGHGWRIKRFTLSIALGATTWYGLSRANPGTVFTFGGVTDAEVILFPGVSQPPQGRPGVQPTIRVSLGPWF